MKPIVDEIVRPAAAGALLPLTVLDLISSHVNWVWLFYFRKAPHIDKLLDSLGMLLERRPIMGAALRGEGSTLWLEEAGSGVRFTAFASEQLPPEAEDRPALFPDSELLPPEIHVASVMDGTQAPTSVQLTVFRDGSAVLAVRNVHTFDGVTAFSLLREWSALYQGLEPPRHLAPGREVIARLAEGHGRKPGAGFYILPPANFSMGRTVSAAKHGYGATQVRLPAAAVRDAVATCKRAVGFSCSSSDILHAMLWKAFAMSTTADPGEIGRVYPTFNLRGVASLNIPEQFDGNAVIERNAKSRLSDLREMTLPEIVAAYCRQIKPITRFDIGRDIAFLMRECEAGHLDYRKVRFNNFLRGSLLDCIDGTGMFINNLTAIRASELVFETPGVAFEAMSVLGFAMVFVWCANNGDFLFRYVGRRETLAAFAEGLEALCVNPLSAVPV